MNFDDLSDVMSAVSQEMLFDDLTLDGHPVKGIIGTAENQGLGDFDLIVRFYRKSLEAIGYEYGQISNSILTDTKGNSWKVISVAQNTEYHTLARILPIDSTILEDNGGFYTD